MSARSTAPAAPDSASHPTTSPSTREAGLRAASTFALFAVGNGGPGNVDELALDCIDSLIEDASVFADAVEAAANDGAAERVAHVLSRMVARLQVIRELHVASRAVGT